MCDYSLHHVASRPAKVGDKLVTTQFNNSITRGFAAVGEPNVAVCLLPGTEVAFEKEIEFERGCLAASGHAATPLPMSAMNSRRLMGLTPRPRITGESIAGLGVGQWRASQ